jgi:hypothetical protein
MQMRTRLACLLALAALLATGVSVASARKPTVVRSGNLVLILNGGVAPKRLPRRTLAPVTLHASGKIATTDGSQPPVAKTITIDFDRHGTIDARGLTACRPGKLESRDTRAAEHACPKAIVGKGATSVRVAFPEQVPFTANGPLVAFNGGVRGGVTTMYIHAYVAVPAPTAIVTRVKVRKIHRGRFGTRAVATIPKIAGGYGAVTKFSLAIHRTFRRGGRKRGYLLARCADGHFIAHLTAAFGDGDRLAGSVLRPCTPRG